MSGSLSSFLQEAGRESDYRLQASDNTEDEYVSDYEEYPSDPEENLTVPTQGNIRFRKNASYRIRYEDPWKIHAAHVCADQLGMNPSIIVWGGDGIRLQDPLPPRILGKKYMEGNPQSKNKVRWQLIKDDEVKLHVIFNNTHWGHALTEYCNGRSPHYVSWAKRLRYRINRYLKGAHDPVWSTRQIAELFEKPDRVSDRKGRSERFLELLKTVDGIFIQRYLAYPEEVWTWERFDLFTLGNISSLLGDEFLDGVLTDKALDLDSAYSQLKRTRKWFKLHSHRETLEHALKELSSEIAPWCRQFLNVYARVLCAKGPRRYFLYGLLSQTRGCGTPPPLVVLQSKRKFLLTISSEVPPENATARALRRMALGEVIASLPDSAFTGLATKARVTVTTSSCWENTRREGGTTEEIRRLVLSGEPGDQVPIRNLETGKIESYGDLSTFQSAGEFIFWSCLDHTYRTPPESLKSAFLTTVKEPGKARSVTKARACLKVVLDVVNKLCSEPLSKGIRSSHSGMAAANHGWNLFNYLSSRELEDIVFEVNDRQEVAYEGYVERCDTFTDLFTSSTDYEEATDQMLHSVAKDLGDAWMRKCGIPSVLRGIVNKTCFVPRNVFFYAEGVLKDIGDPAPDIGDNINKVVLRKGVLMGDPLTKVVLHLCNVVARHLGSRIFDPDFLAKFPDGAAMQEAFRQGFGSRS